MIPIELLKQWFEKNEQKIIDDFFTFLSFQSISTEPSHHPDCLDAAHWITSYLSKIGFNATLWENSGLPVVFGEKQGQGATVLLYHHYDVQPVDPLDLWIDPPFHPKMKDHKVFGRGASDNKGQCFLTLTALKALHEFGSSLPNLKIFIEGEEECGGAGTYQAIDDHKQELQADALCVIDFDLPSRDVPGIPMGYRGIFTAELECENSFSDLHSGVHGGIALSASQILVKLLAKVVDEDGKIAIPNFYDGIEAWENLEKIQFDFDEAEYKKKFGVNILSPNGSKKNSWTQPAFEINGISSGYTGEGFKTVLPAKAVAKLSVRLVPGQDPVVVEKQMRDFFLAAAPKGVTIRFKPHHGAKAYRSSFSSSIIQTVQKSLEEVFKKPCEFTLCGGSVPIVTTLAAVSGAEVALFGFALDSDNVHAPNEHFDWECFKNGFLTMATLLQKCGGES